jgi:hypothetical protein
MAQAYTTIQALQAAGQNPTRDDLVQAIETAGGDWKGPVLAPFRYSADSHMGTSGMSISRLSGTGSEQVKPVQVTDIGNADIKAYDGKPASPPASGIPDEKPAN